jgi:hypothetical protein
MIRDSELPLEVHVRPENSLEWQSAATVLVRLATQEQKEVLHLVGERTPRGMSFEEAKSRLNAIIVSDPERKSEIALWMSRHDKQEQLLEYCHRHSKIPPVSGFYLETMLVELQSRSPALFHEMSPAHILSTLEKSHPMHSWRDDPASDAQKRLLQSKSVRFDPRITKGQAYDLIGPLLDAATEGQVRRLKFYGISTERVTKSEACDLIDDYIAVHPDSENDYQRWKAGGTFAAARQAGPARPLRFDPYVVMIVIVFTLCVVGLIIYAIT